jgi:23S rRNA (guanine2445-N2)-methyltransferase / 23S rRNA (guanine2069-N7)-methyltransferase
MTFSSSQNFSMDAGAEMLANRLRKNLRSMGKWARQQGHSCYRLYDADMPEYAFAIDCYDDFVHLQEYQAPSSVSEEKAEHRRQQAIAAVRSALGVSADKLVLKTRKRQKGSAQYTASNAPGRNFEIREGAARLYVNLDSYLDTGLFLDHRPIRQMLYNAAAGKRFLNLFCYTASATVHAALGGASESLSLDLSNTYLDWAKRNLQLNSINPAKHRLRQRDCIDYLRKSQDQFDLIFLDPPTFSNSKRSDHVLDIQRDHLQLIRNAMRLLLPDGVLLFSCNHRRFKLDESLASEFHVEDISAKTIDRDFQRNPRIHQAWRLTK